MMHQHDSLSRRVARRARPAAFLAVMLTLGAVPASPVPASRVPPVIRLTPAPVVGGNQVVGTVTLNTSAPTGGTTVTITTSSIAVAALQNPALSGQPAASVNVVVPAGQTAAEFRVGTAGVTSVATVTISATTSGETATASLIVLPASVGSVLLNSTIVTGGQTVNATVQLDGRAPPNQALTVAVSASSNVGPVFSTSTTPAVATVVGPSSVVVPAGAARVSFPVTTAPVSAAATGLITASLGRSASASFSLIPPAPTSVQLSPSKVQGGSSASGTVVLNGKAPLGGLAVSLASSNPAVRVPDVISVPVGTDRQTFTISTIPVSTLVRAEISARPTNPQGQIEQRPGFSTIGILTVDPVPVPSAIQLSPAIVIGGKIVTGTVVLSSPAPASGLTVTLAASTADATVPASITIPAGLDRQSFQIATRGGAPTTNVVISARSLVSSPVSDGTSNTTQLSEPVLVRAALGLLEQPRVQSITVQPSPVVGGNAVTVTVRFSTSNSVLSTEQVAAYARSISLVANPSRVLQLPATFSVTGSGTMTGSATVLTPVRSSDQTVQLTAVIVTSSSSTSLLVRAR